MTEFQESDLNFKFNGDWVVCKYDEHRYFRYLSGAGLKGMDFLGIYKKETLVLVEVKNYRIRYTAKPPEAIYRILATPQILTDKIVAKTEDTIQAVRIVNKFYDRNPLFALTKPALPLLSYFSQRAARRFFWTKAQELIEAGQVKVILWIETEKSYAAFSEEELADFSQTLRQQLSQNMVWPIEVYSTQQSSPSALYSSISTILMS